MLASWRKISKVLERSKGGRCGGGLGGVWEGNVVWAYLAVERAGIGDVFLCYIGIHWVTLNSVFRMQSGRGVLPNRSAICAIL